MPALQRVRVLVERGAVEIAEAVRVVGKMAGDPVEYHAEALAMTGIDQSGKVRRGAEAAGRCKKACRLVTPRTIEWVLAHGKEFDMGKAEVANVGGKLIGKLTIGQPLIAALSPPRPEVNFVNRNRGVARIDVWRGGAGTL